MLKEYFIIDKIRNPFDENVYARYNSNNYGIAVYTDKVHEELKKYDNGAINNFAENQYLKIMDENGFLNEKSSPLRPSKSKRRLSVWLHLTNNCNLQCTYCCIHKNNEKMSLQTAINIIDKAIFSCEKNSINTIHLMFMGGEPILQIDLIKKIVKYVELYPTDIKFQYSIITNATLLNSNVADYIKEKRMSVSISLDGIEQYSDLSRIKPNGSGSFKESMLGIENLISKGINPNILITVSPENVNGLPEITEMLTKKELNFRFSLARDTECGNPAILDNEDVCVTKIIESIQIMKKSILLRKPNWHFQFGDVYFNTPRNRCCSSGSNFFAVNQNGMISSCGTSLDNPTLNINDVFDLVTEVKEHFAEINQFSAKRIKKCYNCEFLNCCASACQLQNKATFGTFYHCSPFCNLYKQILPEVIKLYALEKYISAKFQ